MNTLRAWKLDKIHNDSVIYHVMRACKTLLKDSSKYDKIYYRGNTHEIIATNGYGLIVWTHESLGDMLGPKDGYLDLSGDYLIMEDGEYNEKITYERIISNIKPNKKKAFRYYDVRTPYNYYLCEILAGAKILINHKLLSIINYIYELIDEIIIQEYDSLPILLKGSGEDSGNMKFIIMPRRLNYEFDWENIDK